MIPLKSLTLSTIALCALHAVPAYAQTAPSAVPAADAEKAGVAPQVEEIVVTAQKRSENLQNVPIAVSVVTAASLAKASAAGVLDLQTVVPSLKVTNSVARLSLSLRGIGTTAFGPGIENPIAIYVDGVYYASTAASILSFNNIAQIEVLKGPQGTLFGRNATGGLVQIFTREPKNETTAKLDLSYGSYNTVTGNAYASTGVADNLTADVAVHVSHQGTGWGHDLTTGRDVYQLLHDVGVRSKWVFTPGTGTKIILIGDYTDTRDSLSANQIRPGSISPFVAGVQQPDRHYDLVSNVNPLHTLSDGGGSVRVEHGFYAFKLSSTTAYRASLTYLQLGLAGLSSDPESFFQRQKDNQVSEELQLSSTLSERFKWTAGLFFIDSKARLKPLSVNLTDLDLGLLTRDVSEALSVAAYGQGTYAIGPDTNITVGGRYTYEKRRELDATTAITTLSNGSTFVIPYPNRNAEFKKATWRASIDHRFSSELLAYASVNRGFKSGGFNISTPGSAPFKPEVLDAYEGGIKTDLLDRRLRLNISGFYYDYKNIQVPKYVSGSIAIINGAKALSYGVDADLTAVVTGRLSFTASATVLNPKYKSFPGCPIAAPLGGLPLAVGNCAGNQLPLASKFTGSVGADYVLPVHDGKLDFSGSILYNNGYPLDSDNVIKQGGYATMGASVRWSSGSSRFSIAAFGKNLSNKRVFGYGASQANGTQFIIYAEPRVFGLTLGYEL